MDGFKFEVKQGDGFNDVLFLFPRFILPDQLLDGRLHHIRLRRRMERAEDTDRNVSIFAAVFPVVHQDEGMDRLDRFFCQWRIMRCQVDDVIESVLEADDVEMVAQGLFGNGNAFLQDKSRLTKGEGVAFDGVGVVGIFNEEFLTESL